MLLGVLCLFFLNVSCCYFVAPYFSGAAYIFACMAINSFFYLMGYLMFGEQMRENRAWNKMFRRY